MNIPQICLQINNRKIPNMFGVPYPVLGTEHLWLLKSQIARTYSPYPDDQRCWVPKTGYGTPNMFFG